MTTPIDPPPKCDAKALEAQVEAFKLKYPHGFDASIHAPPSAEGKPVEPVPSETKWEQGQCEGCGAEFRAAVIVMLGKELVRARYCNACCERENGRNTEEARAKRTPEQKWSDICPENYRDTDLLRLKRDMAERTLTLQTRPPRTIYVEDIFRHDMKSGRGLGLIGRTGARKTRILLSYLKRCHLAGQGVRYINAVHFGDELAAAYDKGSANAERWMRELERVHHLLIDDLGKEKLTERVETAYYRITEVRQSSRLALHYTANTNGEGLIEKWERSAEASGFYSDRAEAIVRRIREMSDCITVTER